MPVLQFFDDSGKPLVGGRIHTYEPGTLIPKLTYRNSAGTLTNPWPIFLNAAGRNSWGGIWLSGYYDVECWDATYTVMIWSVQNVSSMPWGFTINPEWVPQTLVFTFIDAARFRTVGDYRTTFMPGIRIKAFVTGPPATIFGTVAACIWDPVLGTTTVTCLWSAGALDAGLSAISTGILTPPTNAIPITQPMILTINTVLAVEDMNRSYLVNPAVTAPLLTVQPPAANTVPSGAWFKFVNVNCLQVQVMETISGMVNPLMNTDGEITIVSSGAAWYGTIVHPRPAEFDANSATDETVLDLGTVVMGDRFLVTAYAWMNWVVVPTSIYMTTHQGAGTATIEFSSGLPNSLKKLEVIAAPVFSSATKTDVLKITGSGTLTIHNRIVDDAGTPGYDNKIYVQRLRHI
jgi:hypothetical protein